MERITLGIVGGGQLGRMSAISAAQLGIDVHIYCPEENSPAARVSAKDFVAAYDDETALKQFAESVDVITYEFENIPIQTVQFLKKLKPVFPDDTLLEISQDRADEKSYLNQIDIPTTRWSIVEDSSKLENLFQQWKANDIILKTARFGYDGKGQKKVSLSDNLDDAISKFDGQKLIAEEIVDFECEISVIVARDKNQTIVTYGPMLNEHRNHILHKTTFPAGLDENIENDAVQKAIKLADNINLQGVLTVEYFVTKDGHVITNEIAPRTHNSGHWSIDACVHSQFENHIRAVCGLPVLETLPRQAEMINLIGDDIKELQEYYEQENTCLHLYGKHDSKPGRKMGHVTILKDKS